MLEGMPMEAALDFSNAAAALNCTAIGARGHVPVRQEVHRSVADAKSAKVHRRFADEIVEQVASASAGSVFRN